jgi:lipopolysaccharide export system protein LptA
MKHSKFIAGIAAICACAAASSLSAATIPAGTAITVKTTSQISERDPVGRTFTGQVDQDVVVNGATVLKAGTGVIGKITASRASSRPGRGSAPLGVALTSITANGSNVAINTHSVQPRGATTAQTAQMRSRGVTAGNVLVTPGTTLQFVLVQAVTF